MRLRPGVAIDLGTVNTLIYVSGRGIVLEEPSAIAIDRTTGKLAAMGEAADVLADTPEVVAEVYRQATALDRELEPPRQLARWLSTTA